MNQLQRNDFVDQMRYGLLNFIQDTRRSTTDDGNDDWASVHLHRDQTKCIQTVEQKNSRCRY